MFFFNIVLVITSIIILSVNPEENISLIIKPELENFERELHFENTVKFIYNDKIKSDYYDKKDIHNHNIYRTDIKLIFAAISNIMSNRYLILILLGYSAVAFLSLNIMFAILVKDIVVENINNGSLIILWDNIVHNRILRGIFF
jgi:hypothetical protein